jgi:hypothetical protein
MVRRTVETVGQKRRAGTKTCSLRLPALQKETHLFSTGPTSGCETCTAPRTSAYQARIYLPRRLASYDFISPLRHDARTVSAFVDVCYLQLIVIDLQRSQNPLSSRRCKPTMIDLCHGHPTALTGVNAYHLDSLFALRVRCSSCLRYPQPSRLCNESTIRVVYAVIYLLQVLSTRPYVLTQASR